MVSAVCQVSGESASCYNDSVTRCRRNSIAYKSKMKTHGKGHKNVSPWRHNLKQISKIYNKQSFICYLAMMGWTISKYYKVKHTLTLYGQIRCVWVCIVKIFWWWGIKQIKDQLKWKYITKIHKYLRIIS